MSIFYRRLYAEERVERGDLVTEWTVQRVYPGAVASLADDARYLYDGRHLDVVTREVATEPSHPRATCGHDPCDHYRERWPRARLASGAQVAEVWPALWDDLTSRYPQEEPWTVDGRTHGPSPISRDSRWVL